MPRTPETLPRHELASLPVRVVDATNPSLIGLEGRVRRETQNTLVIATSDGTRVVPKAEATFEFTLTDETAGAPTVGADPDSESESAACKGPGTTSEPAGEGVAYVTVDGARLLSRPAMRTEHTGDSKWESD